MDDQTRHGSLQFDPACIINKNGMNRFDCLCVNYHYFFDLYHRFRSSAQVIVFVEDVNMFAPEFYQSMAGRTFDISESTQPGTYLIELEVTFGPFHEIRVLL